MIFPVPYNMNYGQVIFEVLKKVVYAIDGTFNAINYKIQSIFPTRLLSLHIQ